jgi:hypothetical protein
LILVSVSSGLGLIIGIYVFLVNYNAEQLQRYRAMLLLYLASFVLCGCSFFSILLSFRLLQFQHRKQCCGPYNHRRVTIYALGIVEALIIFVTLAVGLFYSISLLSYLNQNFSGDSNNYWLMMISVPGVYGSLLCFGLPRVVLTSQMLKPKNNPREAEESVPREAETEPLVSDSVNQPPPAYASVDYVPERGPVSNTLLYDD